MTQGFTDADSRLTLLLLLAYGFATIVFRLNMRNLSQRWGLPHGDVRIVLNLHLNIKI